MLQNILDTEKPFKDCEQTTEYIKIISKQFNGKGEAHHILPEVLYPEYAACKWNIVNLEYSDHYKVHELLPFMLDGKARGSMLYAWNLMRNRTGLQCVDASVYADLRKQHSERVTKQMTENNPMHMEGVAEKVTGRKCPEHSERMKGDNNPSKRLEVRKLISENNPMRLEENKEKFRGANNSSFGKHHSSERKELQRIARLGVTLSDETKQKISDTLTRITGSKTLIEIDGVIYDSVTVAATILNKNRHTISRWAKQGKATKLGKQNKRVEINGVVYNSLSESSKALNVSVATIRSYIKHGEATLIHDIHEKQSD